MLLIVLINLLCSRKFGPIFHVLLLGWSAAIGPNHLFILEMLSLATAAHSKGIHLCPLGFSLDLQLVVELIKAKIPNLNFNIWYLNDGTLCGGPVDLTAALEIMVLEKPIFE